MQENDIPKEIDRWNWGAFLFSTLWAIRFRVWIGLLVWIPLIRYSIPILLGVHGSKWAWKKGSFNSIDEFQKSQKRWTIAGIIIWSIILILYGVSLYKENLTKEALIILNKDHLDEIVTCAFPTGEMDKGYCHIIGENLEEIISKETILDISNEETLSLGELQISRTNTSQTL